MDKECKNGLSPRGCKMIYIGCNLDIRLILRSGGLRYDSIRDGLDGRAFIFCYGVWSGGFVVQLWDFIFGYVWYGRMIRSVRRISLERVPDDIFCLIFCLLFGYYV